MKTKLKIIVRTELESLINEYISEKSKKNTFIDSLYGYSDYTNQFNQFALENDIEEWVLIGKLLVNKGYLDIKTAQVTVKRTILKEETGLLLLRNQDEFEDFKKLIELSKTNGNVSDKNSSELETTLEDIKGYCQKELGDIDEEIKDEILAKAKGFLLECSKGHLEAATKFVEYKNYLKENNIKTTKLTTDFIGVDKKKVGIHEERVRFMEMFKEEPGVMEKLKKAKDHTIFKIKGKKDREEIKKAILGDN